jgi:hypothetical protein
MALSNWTGTGVSSRRQFTGDSLNGRQRHILLVEADVSLSPRNRPIATFCAVAACIPSRNGRPEDIYFVA